MRRETVETSLTGSEKMASPLETFRSPRVELTVQVGKAKQGVIHCETAGTAMSDGGRPSNGILGAFGVILRCLEGLSSYNFRKFKNFMSNKDLDNPMGFGLLEEADQLKTARLLLSHYGEAEAVSVTCCVLRQHDLRSAAEELEKEWQKTRAAPLESLETCRERYMKSMRSKYLKMKEKNSNFQSFDLEKRYTKLLLVDKQPKKTEKKKLLTHTGSVHLETMRRLSSGETSTTIEDLFTQNGEEHRIVVLEGPAGIGKTMTINKMMLDWASGKLYQDKFNYLFCITSHKVNRITREMTLAEFIADTFLQECTSDEVEVILNHSEKVLFLVDGLDEFDQAFMTLQGGSSLKFTKESFLNCLLTKPLLRESSLIVTTRPFMLEKLSNYVEVPRYVEIMGLEDREEYFRNFFEDEEQAQDVLGLIKENETLFTLCAVPMTCWIICTVFKHQTKEGLDVQKYNTTTSIYTLYLKSLVKHQGKDLKSDISCHVKRLSALAKEGVWNQKVMFMEVDLERLGLVKSFDSLFLNENVFQRDIEEYTCYSFFHLSVQEFFAALYYLLHEETNDNQKVVHCKSQVRTLLEESEKRPHLASTIRFLFGLSKKKQIKEIESIIGCKIPSRPQSALEDWMKEKQHEPHHRTLMWSYETQDEVFVKKVMSCLPELKIEGLYFCFEESEKNLVDRSLSYCLVKSASNHIVNFYDHTMNPEAFNLLTEGLRKCSKLNFGKCWFPNGDISQLCHLKGKIEKLWLNWCYLMPSCRWHLRSVIVANTSLKQLDLSNNELHELGVKYLCEALTGKGPRLQELRLKSCGLNTLSCVNLAWVIKKGYLTKLDLSDNNLEDLDLPLDIFDELQDKDVRLALTDNKLEDHFSTEIDSIDDRLDVLNYLDRMKITLDLLLYLKDLKVTLSRSHDKKKLLGIKCLFDSLMHLDCALQELSLERCNLPSYVCKDLRSVITANRSLVKLDLSANNLNIRDMKHLCQGLQDHSVT
uniref:NACHT, LRR and PYD domains-containing protein 3 n=1 Tax=Leptobrachium leishanense TaxID=445787 RepID=A0A8C5MUK0_9ANUR